MSAVKTNLSQQHLVQLFESKKLKQTKIYLQQIREFNPAVEKIVINSLQHCLVGKKTTPMGMVTALYFYRELVINAEFDMLESQAFHEQIHQAIYKICAFNGKDQIDSRGAKYFQQNQHKKSDGNNVDQGTLGLAFVRLSLQIICAMREWYPQDYLSQEKSRYCIYYEKLMKNNVKIPKREQFIYMKQSERVRFEKNLAIWKKKIDELEEEIEEEEKEKSKIKQGSKEVQLRTDQLKKQIEKKQIKEQKEAQMRKKQQEKKEREKEAKQLIRRETQIKQQKIQQEPQQESHQNKTSTPKQIQKKPNLQLTYTNKNAQTPSQNFSKDMQLEQPQFILNTPSKTTPNKIQQRAQTLSIPIPTNNTQSSNKNINTSLDQTKSNEKSVLPLQSNTKPSYNNFILNTKITKKTQTKEQFETQKQKDKQKQMHKKMQQIKQSNQDQIRKQKQQHLPKSIKNKIDKMQKIPKRSASADKKIHFISAQEAIIIKRKLSVRKIQKMEKRTIQYDNKFYEEGKHSKLKKYPEANPQTKTLSHYRLEKYQTNQQINAAIGKKLLQKQYRSNNRINLDPVHLYIDRLNLKPYVIPFLPEYFLPVNYKMHGLMTESLKLSQYSTNQASKPFYQDDLISVRLIKNNRQSYILSILNVSHKAIQISYSQALQQQQGDVYSRSIKIIDSNKTRRNNNWMIWSAETHEYVDVKLEFQTVDPNFKFLTVYMVIQGNIMPFILPITLLDFGKISKKIDIEEIIQIDEVHGRLLKSQPLTLHFLSQPSSSSSHLNKISSSKLKNSCYKTNLPHFFSIQQTKQDIQPSIIAQMVYTIQQCEVSIVFMLSKLKDGRYTLSALYDCRQQNNEDFAKVILQLLCLLFYGKIKHH